MTLTLGLAKRANSGQDDGVPISELLDIKSEPEEEEGEDMVTGKEQTRSSSHRQSSRTKKASTFCGYAKENDKEGDEDKGRSLATDRESDYGVRD